MSKNILYLTLSEINLSESGTYSDILNELSKRGHHITVVQADNKRHIDHTCLIEENGIRFLKVLVGELFRINFIKKGINTLKIEPMFKQAIFKFLGNETFDLILYATPPVTFSGVVKACKKRFGCSSYLMLKDIFPQNAVDIGLFKEGSLIHRFFQKKEKILYQVSDMIGCMSNKNKEYLCEHNPYIEQAKVEIFPNTIKVPSTCTRDQVEPLSTEFQIPQDRVVFVFGGNLGKPQGIDFLMSAIKALENYESAYFLIVGNGSEAGRVREAVGNLRNAKYLSQLPVKEYDQLMKSCDVGILSLDIRFTIPNYPSRALAYMALEKPILASTDRVTDIHELVEQQAKCGLWCASDDLEAFCNHVKTLCENQELRKQYGMNGRRYLEQNFDVKRSVELIENRM